MARAASVSAVTMTPSQLLDRIGEEIATLRTLVRDLPVATQAVGAEAMTQAQTHDLVEQTLGELAAFLRAGAQAFEDGGDGDLSMPLAAIRLADLANRIAGCVPHALTTSGDVDFF